MTAQQMIADRRSEWTELESAIAMLARGGRRHTPEQLSRFSLLFRNVCADLARARAHGLPEDLIDYLNALAARAHNVFYVAPAVPVGQVWGFFGRIFPLTVYQCRHYLAVALLLFFGPMLLTAWLARTNDQVVYELIPKAMLEQFEKMYQKGHSQGRSESQDTMMAGFYVYNNVGIAFRCFATGVFFGLGSLFFLIFNGVHIGATIGFVSGTSSGANLLSFIAGHGPFELIAIAISGAAGLRLGFGALITGSRRRTESLRIAALAAVKLVLGAAALLLGAALIEGFLSPSSLPNSVKFAVGGICLASLIWYLGFYAARVARRDHGQVSAPDAGGTAAVFQ